jgi:hypothetical protein
MALADQIIGAESGGSATAKNERSTATGAGQFIESTWLGMLAKHRPDLTGSPADLLALRNDPQLSKDMTAAYAADNGAILSKAGLPVNAGTSYLAHFAGPSGAVGLLNADPATPAGSIMGPAAMKANPFLSGMTAGDVAAWANRKMGGQAAPMSMAGPAQPAAAPAQQAAPQQPAAAPVTQQQPQYASAPAAAMPTEAAPVAQILSLLPKAKILKIPPFSLRGYS